MQRAERRRLKREIDRLEGQGIRVNNITGDPYLLNPLVVTGESNARCYGRSLGSCSGPISREHFISENVLHQVGSIPSAGIPWLAHLNRDLSVNDLVANCLCAYHNAFLSPLDQLAGRAFEASRRFGNHRDEAVIIYGPSFERWLLKAFIGLIGTRQLEDARGDVGIGEIPEEWIRILFGLEEFPEGLGMYSANLIGGAMRAGLGIQTLMLDGVLAGIRAKFGSLELYLSMAPKGRAFRTDHPQYQNILYRPNKYDVPEIRSSLSFHWQ